MIAKNYRTFPEALLYQLELVLGNIEDTLDHIRKTNSALWAVWTRVLTGAKDDDRGERPVPSWWRRSATRRRALALALLAAQLSFIGLATK